MLAPGGLECRTRPAHGLAMQATGVRGLRDGKARVGLCGSLGMQVAAACFQSPNKSLGRALS